MTPLKCAKKQVLHNGKGYRPFTCSIYTFRSAGEPQKHILITSICLFEITVGENCKEFRNN